MDLSSLVFVAIIGVWAAYLVPHWLSKRDDISQSSSSDRHSGGLRVLKRRSRKQRPDRGGHRSGDAVLTSPRVVVDADGEFLYIPADRALAARAEREAAAASLAEAEAASLAEAEAEVAVAVAAEVAVPEAIVSAPMPGFLLGDVPAPEAPAPALEAPATEVAAASVFAVAASDVATAEVPASGVTAADPATTDAAEKAREAAASVGAEPEAEPVGAVAPAPVVAEQTFSELIMAKRTSPTTPSAPAVPPAISSELAGPPVTSVESVEQAAPQGPQPQAPTAVSTPALPDSTPATPSGPPSTPEIPATTASETPAAPASASAIQAQPEPTPRPAAANPAQEAAARVGGSPRPPTAPTTRVASPSASRPSAPARTAPNLSAGQADPGSAITARPPAAASAAGRPSASTTGRPSASAAARPPASSAGRRPADESSAITSRPPARTASGARGPGQANRPPAAQPAPKRPASSTPADSTSVRTPPLGDNTRTVRGDEIAMTTHRSVHPRPPVHRPSSEPPRRSAPLEDDFDRPSDLEVAIGNARVAARRRAVIMTLLFLTTAVSWVAVSASALPNWAAAPATVLLVLHVLASRVAGLRSREALMLLAVQVRTAEQVHARIQRQPAARTSPAEDAAPPIPTSAPERVARRAAAVGAETWEPIPVPPPTYTLKPAVHRPEPAPASSPAPEPLEKPAAASGEAPAAAVSRGALPRRASDVERILALESPLDELFEEPKVVNG